MDIWMVMIDLQEEENLEPQKVTVFVKSANETEVNLKAEAKAEALFKREYNSYTRIKVLSKTKLCAANTETDQHKPLYANLPRALEKVVNTVYEKQETKLENIHNFAKRFETRTKNSRQQKK